MTYTHWGAPLLVKRLYRKDSIIAWFRRAAFPADPIRGISNLSFPILGLLVAGVILVINSSNAWSESDRRVFTIAKYPVDASAANAVTAKRDALEQGRKAAFRSLLKRLVPAASYSLVDDLKSIDPEQFITSVAVRSEENSTTQYVATLDFSFDEQTVRQLLNQRGVAYVDLQAPVTHLLTLYSAPPAGGSKAMAAAGGGKAWRSIWAGLDLANSVTPLKLSEQPVDPAPEMTSALIEADPAAIAELAAAEKSGQVIVAHAQPLPASNELAVTLAGQDATGRFSVRTRYRLDTEDFQYSLELAAVIAQGVLEGRWKMQQTVAVSGSAGGGAPETLRVLAEFNDLGQWQRQQQLLADTPGIRNIQIGSLSGRSASIDLSYPGGGEALQAALGTRGLTLENINGFWILR